MSTMRTTTDVRPFRALHYDPRRVDLADVVSPPYDVIGPALREQLAARSPYNVVHLILPEPGHEEDAGAAFARWRTEGVVVSEPRECLYWLEQHYVGPDGVARVRSGVIATLRLEPYERGAVRPHERTLEGPKSGRLALLRAVRANLSPIFAVYDDPERRVSAAIEPVVAERDPVLEVRDDDGTLHRLWRVCDDRARAALSTSLADIPIVIADGHHRYETALDYRRERRAAEGDPPGDRPYDFAPVYLANRWDPGLEPFATHRVLLDVEPELWRDLERRLADDWELRRVEGDADDLFAALAREPHGEPAFALWRGAGTRGVLARLRRPDVLAAALRGASAATRSLDVAAVSALVLDRALGLDPGDVARTGRIRYRRKPSAAAALVEEAPGSALALLVRAPTVADVEAVAAAGETMPQKSTFFFPKILDGMVFHRLDDA